MAPTPAQSEPNLFAPAGGFARGLLLMAMHIGCSARDPRGASDEAVGPPKRGGTLHVVGDSDVDHLATTSGYVTGSIWLFRAFARQLISYPSATDYATATALAPDVARELPTRDNGGISADGRSYTLHLRPNVRWNSAPPRPVVAGDFVRAFKLMCNPVAPVGAPSYYTNTIAGMAAYCSALGKVPPTVGELRQFIASHELAGIRAPDDATLVFELVAPTPDFLNLLAMQFASAVPEEYLDYLPDSPEFRQHTLSDGPYAITEYVQGRTIELERNPAWEAASDPLRPAYVDRISLRFGIDPELGQLQIEAGTADLAFDASMLTANLASLREIGDRRVTLYPPGDKYGSMHYLVINLVGPNNGGALANLQVRQALAMAVDKRALVQLSGGPGVSRALRQAVPSSVAGFRPDADSFVTPRDQGDPVAARRLLGAAGFPDDLRLRLVFPQLTTFPIEAQAIQASLRRAGFDVTLVPYPSSDLWGRLLPNAANARSGEWDVALTGWDPDWFGDTNGRAVISPLFDGRDSSMNYGRYASQHTDSAIDRALTAATDAATEAAWAEAARQAMDDVAIVPLIERKSGWMRSSRARNCLWTVEGNQCDLTALWLGDAESPR